MERHLLEVRNNRRAGRLLLKSSGNQTNSQLRAPYSSYKRGVNGPLQPTTTATQSPSSPPPTSPESAQYRDSLEEQDFVQKVSRFEYLTHGSKNDSRPPPPSYTHSSPGGTATSPISTGPRSPPLGGVTYLHASPPGLVHTHHNGSASDQPDAGAGASSSPNGASKKTAATTTISVVLKSLKSSEDTSGKESKVENGDAESGAEVTVLDASVREDTKGYRGLTLTQRAPSPSSLGAGVGGAGPISPIRSVQHKTISFKSPPATVTSSATYASSNPQFAHTVAKTGSSLTTRSPSPVSSPEQKTNRLLDTPNTNNTTSLPSPTGLRKRTPTPPPRPNRDAAKAVASEQSPRSNTEPPPPSPTTHRRLASSPTVNRKFPVVTESSPTAVHRGIPELNGRGHSSSCGNIPLAPESPKPAIRDFQDQTPKFPTFPESPRSQRKFPLATPESPKPKRKLPDSPKLIKKFPTAPDSPEPSKKVATPDSPSLTESPSATRKALKSPESPRLTRKFPVPPESPAPTRKFPTTPESPSLTRKFPTTPESPSLTRKLPTTPESPSLTRKFPTTPESPSLTRKFPTTPASPSLTRKFPTTPESPSLTRKFPITPQSPIITRKFPTTPESPSLTRKFPTTPESPKPQRRVISPKADISVSDKPPLSPTSPKLVRKFTAENSNGGTANTVVDAVPHSPSAKRKGIILPLASANTTPVTTKPSTPPSPGVVRRTPSTPPPVLPKPQRSTTDNSLTPPPIPPHATPLGTGSKKAPLLRHQGEKVFTKDTAIVQRVAIPGFGDKKSPVLVGSGLSVGQGASELGSEADSALSSSTSSRVISGISTASSSSFTSVSSMSSTLSSETTINKRESQQSKDSLVTQPHPNSSSHLESDITMEINANLSSPESPTGNGLLHSSSHRDGVALDDLSETDLDLDDLTGSQQDLKALHEKMVAERKKEQEMAALEKQRLEEILNMCAEYERQIEQERLAGTGMNPALLATMDQNLTTTTTTATSTSLKVDSPPPLSQEANRSPEGTFGRPESRNSMTKIKTNGSLTMLSSPGATHKDVSFEHWRRRSSNSSASEDDLGSENGTIKRRPNNGHMTTSHVMDTSVVGSNQAAQQQADLVHHQQHKLKEASHKAYYYEDTPDAGGVNSSVNCAGSLEPEKNNNSSSCSSPDVQNTGMRLQLVKIGDGTYAGPVLRSVINNGPNASNTELSGTVPLYSENSELSGTAPLYSESSTTPGSDERSPRSCDLRSPADSDHSRQQLATPSSSGVETSSDLSLNKIDDGELMSQIDRLKYQRTDAIQKIAHLKQEIVEIETQENESIRELEMERALLEGEHQMEVDTLAAEREKINALKQRQLELLELAALQRQKEQERMEAEQEKLRMLESRRYQTQQLLEACAPEDEDQLTDRLRRDQEMLDAQRKLYDDLEFQQLETETRYEEEREKVQRDLLMEQNELMATYHDHENKLQQIDLQQRDMLRSVKSDIEGLEQHRQVLVEQFRKEKARLSSTEKRIRELSRLLPLDESSKLRDFEGAAADGKIQLKKSNADYINRVKDESITNSPPTERKMSQTLVEIEKNRLMILESQGNSVIDDECRRLYDLKQRAAQEVRAQWEEKKIRENNYKSFNSLESEESSVGSSGETPSEKETSLSSGEDHLEKLAEMERLLTQQVQADKLATLEQQLQLHIGHGGEASGHQTVKQREAELVALQEEREKRLELERRLAEETLRRDELVEHEIRLREQARHQARPLTRYLPIRGAEFDLKVHIESAGHNLDGAAKHVKITATTCRGFLTKMGSKFRTWNRRWFLFDRTRRSLLYFSDKSETKPRGGIYFQSIEEVYVDHLRQVKSPNAKLTFCLKTFDRTYYLVAPSPEAMRIWIDVIFTGAEGYQEFL